MEKNQVRSLTKPDWKAKKKTEKVLGSISASGVGDIVPADGTMMIAPKTGGCIKQFCSHLSCMHLNNFKNVLL